MCVEIINSGVGEGGGKKIANNGKCAYVNVTIISIQVERKTN